MNREKILLALHAGISRLLNEYLINEIPDANTKQQIIVCMGRALGTLLDRETVQKHLDDGERTEATGCFVMRPADWCRFNERWPTEKAFLLALLELQARAADLEAMNEKVAPLPAGTLGAL